MPDPNSERAELARRLMQLLDLTRLEDDDDDGPVRALCRRAGAFDSAPAAVCVYPRYIEAARAELDRCDPGGRIRIATVVNFPAGHADPAATGEETEAAVALGADEIDVVFPWRALLEGDEEVGRELVERCRTAAAGRPVKVILETGELIDAKRIRLASEIALAGGADFLKTSTGKTATGATPEAAETMLETIRVRQRDAGLKVSGGVRTFDDAAGYVRLAARIMGAGWVEPDHFRIGASSLADDLAAVLEDSGS